MKHGLSTLVVVAAVATMGSFYYGIGCIYFIKSPPVTHLLFSLKLMAVAIPGFLYMVWLEEKKVAQWKHISLLEYDELLPQEVEVTIQEIQKFCPDACTRMRLDIFEIGRDR